MPTGGQYADEETGLYYNLHRYYDPTIGRYTQTDPAGDGLNPYLYAAANPVNAIDPNGLCALRMGGGAQIAAGIGIFVKTGGLGSFAAWVMAANGLDNIVAGTRSLDGTYHRSILQSAIHYGVRNELAAELLYAGSQLGIGLAGLHAAGQITTLSQTGRFIGEEIAEEVIESVTGVPVGFINGIKGTLTATEIAEIHAIAKKYDTTIDAVGSRAYEKGRAINTNFPEGKGDYTRSDIDFRINTKHPLVNDLMKELNNVSNEAGKASLKHGTRQTYQPFIRFTPQKVILVNE
ncbi:MAG: RHS repeat-associated core domain-containing protein, partial [Chloroflexi bacterium]|nr:RHS repeat-associated core domain-containing protein [Chloroflexota bacterium]